MTDSHTQPYAAFRLNLEQQHKRAKDLLKAAKAREAHALRRLQDAGFATPEAGLLVPYSAVLDGQAPPCGGRIDVTPRALRMACWAGVRGSGMS